MRYEIHLFSSLFCSFLSAHRTLLRSTVDKYAIYGRRSGADRITHITMGVSLCVCDRHYFTGMRRRHSHFDSSLSHRHANGKNGNKLSIVMCSLSHMADVTGTENGTPFFNSTHSPVPVMTSSESESRMLVFIIFMWAIILMRACNATSEAGNSTNTHASSQEPRATLFIRLLADDIFFQENGNDIREVQDGEIRSRCHRHRNCRQKRCSHKFPFLRVRFERIALLLVIAVVVVAMKSDSPQTPNAKLMKSDRDGFVLCIGPDETLSHPSIRIVLVPYISLFLGL